MRPAHPILVTLLAAAAATVAVAIGACANPDTQTPSCTPNVDVNGIRPDPNGCEQFAYCGPNGVAADCCKDAKGVAFTGNDLATCLHGFGDPSCAYLVSAASGTGVSFTCSATPPSGTGGGSTGGDGG